MPPRVPASGPEPCGGKYPSKRQFYFKLFSSRSERHGFFKNGSNRFNYSDYSDPVFDNVKPKYKQLKTTRLGCLNWMMVELTDGQTDDHRQTDRQMDRLAD